MPTSPSLPRVAIGQLRMQWSIEDNMASILSSMAFAATREADICVFPELAVTGFHRQIAALAIPELVQPWLAAIQSACANHSMAVAIGCPSFGSDARIFNSHILVNEVGLCTAVVEKNGLTAPEATFFTPGTARAVGQLQGLRCTSVICREVEDFDEVCAQLPLGAADLIFWPGLMRPEPGKPITDPPAHVVHARRLAQKSGTYIVQANWPNSLNYPAESEHSGQSVVIDPQGKLVLKLPRAEPGVAIFALGESAYEWRPCD
jgi:omega-amidase